MLKKWSPLVVPMRHGWIVSAVLLFTILLASSVAQALILVGRGNAPVTDHNWPAGSLELANLKTRVGWWEGPPFGGGQHNFLYRGGVADFQQAIDLFAKIHAPKLQLYIHDGGPAQSGFLKDPKDKKSDTRYDWSFTLWNPESWNHLYNQPGSYFSAQDPNGGLGRTVDPPRIDVFAGGSIDLSKIKVPANISLTDERADVAGFPGGSAIVGDAYDMTTSKPVAGMEIAIGNDDPQHAWKSVASAKSDSAGHFVLRHLPKGAFAVRASAGGFAARLVGYVELRGNTLKRYTVQLAPAAEFSGVAIDTQGKPVPNITVRVDSIIAVNGRGYLVPKKLQVQTDAQGKFKIIGLPRGHGQLFAYGTHYHMLDVLKLYAFPSDGLTIHVTATGAIKGRVVDKAGKPATHGNVEIEPPGSRLGKWGASGNTKPDGSFEFENVPPGEYIVSAMASNPGPALPPGKKDPNAKTITVKPGQTTEVEVTGR